MRWDGCKGVSECFNLEELQLLTQLYLSAAALAATSKNPLQTPRTPKLIGCPGYPTANKALRMTRQECVDVAAEL